MKIIIAYLAVIIIFTIGVIFGTGYQIQDHLDQKIETHGGNYYTLRTSYGNDIFKTDYGSIREIDSLKCIRAKQITEQYKLYQKLKNKKCN